MNKADSAFQNRNASEKQTPGELPDFSKLYDQYAAIILGVLIKLVKDESQATSLLEVVFRNFMGQANQLHKAEQPLFVSLLQSARRTAIDALTESQRSNIVSLQLTDDRKNIRLDGQKAALTHADISQNIPSEDQRKQLLDSVLFKKCTLEEAASSTGIPLDMARQQLRLAFQQMRTPRA